MLDIAIKALGGLSKVLCQPVMIKSEFCNHHEREAARLRALAPFVSSPVSKARLLEQAEEQERFAEELEDLRTGARLGFP